MRVLSGVQPSGGLHIGNYYGAIRQFVSLQAEHQCYFFLADMHALTTVQDAEQMRENSRHVVAAFLALGLDPERSVLYRQSDVPEVAELMWYLSTVTTMGLLQRCHSYKDKTSRGLAPSHGLFSYPVLMAADILIVDADLVPVGKDQKQHLEVTRDLVTALHTAYGRDDLLRMPKPLILDDVAVVPGLDGQKMSKSYGNAIELFGPEKPTRKRIMSIVTDSTPVEEPKPTQGSSLYQLLRVLAPEQDREWVENAFAQGGIGYGDLKKRLFTYFMETFGEARQRYEALQRSPDEVEAVLMDGARRAREATSAVLDRLRGAVGFTTSR